MEDFSREDRGIFQGIKVPFCLNAIILAFMAYVIFLAGARLLGWVMHDNVAYEKVVYTLQEKAIRNMPVLKEPIKEIVLRSADVNFTTEQDGRIKVPALRNAFNDHIDDLRKRKEYVIAETIDFGDFVKPQWWKYLIFAVWFLLLWSFFAGAINRTAAYRIARDESITLREGLNFGAQTWSNHFLAIVFIAIFLASAFFLCVLASFVLGLIPYVGELVLIFVFMLILVAAFLITLLLAGFLFGFNMISSAIGVDKVDSFDAISRSYSYVLGRPWQTLLYTVLPLLFVVIFLYFGAIFQKVAVKSLAWGMGEGFQPFKNIIELKATWSSLNEPWTIKLSAYVIRIFLWLANFFIIATAIMYWLSSRTKAYFLLRKEVDGDEVEEMYLEEEDEALELPEPAPSAPAEEKAEEKPKKAEEKKEEKKKYTEDELENLPMDELRAVGKKLEITGRSKKKIIERILKEQGK